MTFGVALDIDGVLVKDEKPIKGAAESLQLLQKHQIPFVFVTNGMLLFVVNFCNKVEVL